MSKTQGRELVIKDDDSDYAIVTKKLGNGRFMIRLNMRKDEMLGRLCGKFKHGKHKRNNWVDVDSVVLVGIREFQTNVVDIVHVYDSAEARQLKKMGEFIDVTINENTETTAILPDDDIGFDFEEL
jgi:translation initiation factor 1A